MPPGPLPPPQAGVPPEVQDRVGNSRGPVVEGLNDDGEPYGAGEGITVTTTTPSPRPGEYTGLSPAAPASNPALVLNAPIPAWSALQRSPLCTGAWAARAQLPCSASIQGASRGPQDPHHPSNQEYCGCAWKATLSPWLPLPQLALFLNSSHRDPWGPLRSCLFLSRVPELASRSRIQGPAEHPHLHLAPR